MASKVVAQQPAVVSGTRLGTASKTPASPLDSSSAANTIPCRWSLRCWFLRSDDWPGAGPFLHASISDCRASRPLVWRQPSTKGGPNIEGRHCFTRGGILAQQHGGSSSPVTAATPAREGLGTGAGGQGGLDTSIHAMQSSSGRRLPTSPHRPQRRRRAMHTAASAPSALAAAAPASGSAARRSRGPAMARAPPHSRGRRRRRRLQPVRGTRVPPLPLAQLLAADDSAAREQSMSPPPPTPPNQNQPASRRSLPPCGGACSLPCRAAISACSCSKAPRSSAMEVPTGKLASARRGDGSGDGGGGGACGVCSSTCCAAARGEAGPAAAAEARKPLRLRLPGRATPVRPAP